MPYYLFFFWDFVGQGAFFLPGWAASSVKSKVYFCNSSSLRLLAFRSSSFSSFSCFFSSLPNIFVCCSSSMLAVWGTRTQQAKETHPQLTAKVPLTSVIRLKDPSARFPSELPTCCLDPSIQTITFYAWQNTGPTPKNAFIAIVNHSVECGYTNVMEAYGMVIGEWLGIQKAMQNFVVNAPGNCLPSFFLFFPLLSQGPLNIPLKSQF